MIWSASFMHRNEISYASGVGKFQDRLWTATLHGLRWRFIDTILDTLLCTVSNLRTPHSSVPHSPNTKTTDRPHASPAFDSILFPVCLKTCNPPTATIAVSTPSTPGQTVFRSKSPGRPGPTMAASPNTALKIQYD